MRIAICDDQPAQLQLYISVQNAAKEILNFNERNYITSKRVYWQQRRIYHDLQS